MARSCWRNKSGRFKHRRIPRSPEMGCPPGVLQHTAGAYPRRYQSADDHRQASHRLGDITIDAKLFLFAGGIFPIQKEELRAQQADPFGAHLGCQLSISQAANIGDTSIARPSRVMAGSAAFSRASLREASQR